MPGTFRRADVERPTLHLSAWIRLIDEAATWVELADRLTVQLAVIALAEAYLLANLDVTSFERDLCGLDGASQVGGKHAHDPVAPASLAERTREKPPFTRELAGMRSRSDTALVVD